MTGSCSLGRSGLVAVVVVAVVSVLPGGVRGAAAEGGRAGAPAEESPAPKLAADGPKTAHGREIPGLRTRTSRTYLNEAREMVTLVSAAAVNFRDAEGAWRPIDNTLVEMAGGYRNRANAYAVELPADLGAAPVRVRHDGVSVAFSLRGASGRASVKGATARYANALGRVELAYAALGNGVKETLTLAGPAAPSRFVFDLALEGLTARAGPAGAVELVGTDGRVRGEFTPAYMVDAAGAVSRAVSLQLEEGGRALSLTLDRAWLASSERRWPVVVDPTYEYWGGDRECYIQNGTSQNTSFCNLDRMSVGFDGSQTSRALVYYGGIDIPRHAVVLDAELTLYLEAASTTNTAPVSVHRVTRSWGLDATWNQAQAGTSWTSAGGDFDSTATATLQSVGGTTGAALQWPVRKLVQGWVDGSLANNGLLVKQQAESVNNVLRFSTSWSTATGAQPPVLRITWERGIGLWGRYRFVGQDLSDRLDLQANVANGNLVVEEETLGIAGRGQNLSLSRYYNSLSSIGWADWRMSTGNGVYLEETDDRSIAYHASSGFAIPFVRQADGTYESPTAINATLVKNGDATYKLSYHADRSVENFNSSGRLVSEVDANGNTISYAYSAEGDLTSITDTRGRVTTLTYNTSCSLLATVTDPAARKHSWAYNTTSCMPTSYTDPAAGVTKYAYDATATLITQITDPKGNITKLSYDSERRVTSIVRVVANGTGPTTSFTYNAGNTVVTDPNGNKTTFHYDPQGRVTKVVDALARERAASWTPNSDLLEFTSASGAKTTNGYDANNNLTSSKTATGASSSWEYADPNQRFYATKATDTQGNATSFAYDAKGNLSSLTNALASSASLTYNADGSVASAKDFKGNLTGYGYDASGHLTLVDHPAPLGDESYTYDSLSRVATHTDGKGQKTTYAYDALDQVTSITYHDGSKISYAYDKNGNVSSMADNTGTTSFAYDTLNRLTKETLPNATSNTYTYDNASNLLSFADGGGTVKYAYNQLNLLATVTEPSGAQTTFVYDTDDLRTQTNYPNGVSMYLTYDAANRLTRVTGKKPASGTVLTDLSYEWKNALGADSGLRHAVTDKDGNRTSYSYDALNRLTKAEERNSAGMLLNSYAYAYDASSNRSSQTVNGVGTTYTHNGADQLTAAGSVTYSYDGNGNETGNSAGRAWTYNVKDQAVSVTPPGGSALSMSYTGTGQFLRVSAGSASYQNSSLGVTRENTTSYTKDDDGLLLSLRSSSGTFYYLLDGLGSVAAVTDGAGTVAASYSYEPFGKVKSSTGTLANPYRWLGGLGVYFDASTGLYKMGTRYYDPGLGRFTQVDPVEGGSANRYDYANQDPINNADLDGQAVFVPVALLALRVAPYAVRAGIALHRAGRSAKVASRLAARAATKAGVRVKHFARRAAPRVYEAVKTCLTRGLQYFQGLGPGTNVWGRVYYSALVCLGIL